MISLTERQENISNFLLKAENPVGVEELSRRFAISKRSVYYDLDMIERWAKAYNLTLIKDSRRGIVIESDKTSTEDLDYHIYLSPENRKRFILLCLFFSKGYLSAHEMSQRLSVSRNTILNDIKSIRANLNLEELSIQGVRSHGYILSGDEKQIRSYFTKFVMSIATTYELVSLVIKEEASQMGTILEYFVSKVDFPSIKACVKAATKKYHFWLPDIDYIRFIIYHALSVERIKNGYKIEKNIPFSAEIKDSVEYHIAKSVCLSIADNFSLKINDPEIINTAKMLLTCNIKTNGSRSNRNLNRLLKKTVNEMIKAIVPFTSFNDKAYNKLRQDIQNHLELTIKQLKFGVIGNNPLLEKIKIHYSQSYKLAEQMASVFSDHMDIQLPESEIGFIALHIAVYLETALENRKNLRAIVICNSGKGSANILTKRLRKCIPELEIKGNFSILEIEENKALLDDVDLIISTIKYVNNLKPVLIITPLLSDNEIYLIKNFINKEEISFNEFSSEEPKKNIINALATLIRENLDDVVAESMVDELRKIEFYFQENYIHRNQISQEEGFGSDIIALIVLEMMNMINELQELDVPLSKEETTGLLIHVIMSVSRWKRGDFFEEAEFNHYRREYPKRFNIAVQFLEKCQSILGKSISEHEVISILRYFTQGER